MHCEIDGDSHAEQIECVQARTAYLNELGYTVIRFTNREVFNHCEAVLQHIADKCQRLIAPRHGLRQRYDRRGKRWFDSKDEITLQSDSNLTAEKSATGHHRK